jgi:hypothetical protein
VGLVAKEEFMVISTEFWSTRNADKVPEGIKGKGRR